MLLFGDVFAALFESSLTLFLAFFKRRSMAAMESSSSFMSPDSSDDDDDAASMMRIVVPFFVRFVVVVALTLVVFLPADPFEDEEKAEETRLLCASRDREDRGVLNIIIII